MSLPNYLAKIKSSGVYRYVFDKSEVPQQYRRSLRLVVGYSERGPFNTPVYISDAAEFIKTFGNISRRMERKGVFFHRMAIQALEAGPILALNLKPFSDKEVSRVMSFNASDIVLQGAKNAGTDEAGNAIAAVAGAQIYNADLLEWARVTDAVGDTTLDLTYGKENGLNAIYDTNRFWHVNDNLFGISTMKNKTDIPPVKIESTDYIRIVQTGSREDSVTLFIRPCVPTGYNIKISDWYSNETPEEMPAYMENIKDHMLSEFFVEIYVFKGDLRKSELWSSEGTLGSWKREFDATANQFKDPVFMPFCNADGTTVWTNPDYVDAYGRVIDPLEDMCDVDNSNFIGKYQGILFPNFKDTSGSFISLDSVFNADTTSHKCLMALNEALLDDAYDIDMNNNGLIDADAGEELPSYHPEVAESSIASLVHKLCSATHSKTSGDGLDYKADYDEILSPVANAKVYGYYMEGYTYQTINRAMSGQELIENKIYAVLGYKGIKEALSNNVDVDYKYWVDTFQAYPHKAMKDIIAGILKRKFNCLGILNFPPMADCATFCGYPGMVGGFDMDKVVRRNSGITLPAEVQGASWCAFYTQLKMTDGTNTFVVPSAALVSNLFMNKWSSRLPYYIVAGPNYGRIDYPGVVGPDYNYARPDLDCLEPFGVNAIIYIPRKGVIINSNQTAKQTPVSALSKVHVRELITYLQDTIEDMLYGYQWEFNNSTLRDQIRAKAEVILGLCQANSGIYAYRVTCDDSNNPQEVVDNEMVVLDVEIEPARGAGKMIQTLTIHRTGGIAATPRN